MEKKWIRRLKALEERVAELETEKQNRHGEKSQFYADWIMSQFKKKDYILIADIKEAAKKKGYSWQMITKAKREMLDLGTRVGNNKEGWAWVKI